MIYKLKLAEIVKRKGNGKEMKAVGASRAWVYGLSYRLYGYLST